jgi:hypothetical protein
MEVETMTVAVAVNEGRCRVCLARPIEHYEAEMCHRCLVAEMDGPRKVQIDLSDEPRLKVVLESGGIRITLDAVQDVAEIGGTTEMAMAYVAKMLADIKRLGRN